MADLVAEILKRHGPCLTGQVAAILVAEHGHTPTAARQRVTRRSSAVKTLRGLQFPRNASFVYLEDQYGRRQFWQNLSLALGDGVYARAITALHDRGGIMPTAHFGIACGAPLVQQRQVSADEVRTRMVAVGLFQEVNIDGTGACVSFARGMEYLEVPANQMKARLITESIVLSALKNWARNVGFGSYNRFELRTATMDQPRIGPYQWDIAVPSYVGGLSTRGVGESKAKPGFIAFDVLLGVEINDRSLAPFIHKCITLRSLKNIGRCMQFFVVDRMTPEALRLGRSYGVLPVTTATLFGQDVAEALRNLTAVLIGAARASVDPLQLQNLFAKLEKIEGATNTLRGALFEFIAAELARREFRGNVEMNRKYRRGGMDLAEIDVLIVVPNQIVHFIECKGYLPGRTVPHAEVEKWLHKRVPELFKLANEHPDWKNLDYRFELWTTGELSPESRTLIQNLQNSVRPEKYVIEIRTARDIEAMAVRTQDAGLVHLLRNHFLAHPLAGLLASDELTREELRALDDEATAAGATHTEHSPVPLDLGKLIQLPASSKSEATANAGQSYDEQPAMSKGKQVTPLAAALPRIAGILPSPQATPDAGSQ